jgi:hypothetical protein
VVEPIYFVAYYVVMCFPYILCGWDDKVSSFCPKQNDNLFIYFSSYIIYRHISIYPCARVCIQLTMFIVKNSLIFSLQFGLSLREKQIDMNGLFDFRILFMISFLECMS